MHNISQQKTVPVYGFIIPVYNHGRSAVTVSKILSQHGLPIILIDDGSDSETKNYLACITAENPLAEIVTLAKNSGKGGAVIAGIRRAYEKQLSHVFQIDADGQHDISCCSAFIEQSKKHPQALICGEPEYDSSVPESRKNGRKFGNMMAKIVTLSGDIRDAMCGFRIYPVEQTWKIVSKAACIDKRMGFDLEILIRLKWKNVPFMFIPVHISYPEDGISHFHMIRDNARISWMFTRTCCGMVLRIPLLLFRKIRHTERYIQTGSADE